jgi:hypothetical protein
MNLLLAPGSSEGNVEVMDVIWARLGTHLIARITGPMKFRVFLQPSVAAFFAVRSGLADARAGKVPYLWALLMHHGRRGDIIRDAWKSVGRVFIFALILDVIYQVVVLHTLHPGQAIIVAFILAIVPYIIVRGLTTRVARLRSTKSQPSCESADLPVHNLD